MADPSQPDKVKPDAPDEEDEAEESAESSAERAAGPAGSCVGGSPSTADAAEQYRTLLSTLERDSQRSYDKAILTLSGGALGVTISVLKNVIHTSTPVAMGFLLASWVCWGLSLSSVLYSFYSSTSALRKAIVQLDDGTIGKQHPGGVYDLATAVLNAASGLFFLAGTFLFVYFAYVNMGERHG